jgi:thiol-disulfide isomerase/thioredoxin
MKSHVALFCFLLATASVTLATAEKPAVPFRELSFDAATKAAATEGKLVFIDFYTTWCGPCKMLDAQTWSDAGVGKLIGDKAVPLKIDAEKERNLSHRYTINAYPTLLLLKPDGSEVDRIVGFRDPARFTTEFTKLLALADSGKTGLQAAQAAAADVDPENAQPHFVLAEQLTRAGKSEEALKELLWCWNEGKQDVEFARMTRTSRVPHALATLGRNYPPAQDALVRLRDEAHQRALTGRGGANATAELIQLNVALHAPDDTLAAFDAIPVGDQRRNSISIYLFDELVKRKRYTDALTAYSLDTATRTLNRTPPPEIVARFGEARVKEIRRSSILYVAKRVEPLIGAGRIEDAKQLGAKILEADSSDEIKTFLHQAAKRAGHPEVFATAPTPAPKA